MNNTKMALENRCKMRLTIVSPVNIADGTTLTPKDYLYDSKKGIMYFLNQKLWNRFILKNKLINDYQKYLTDFREKRSLLEWLNTKGYTLDNVKECIISFAVAEVNVLKDTKKNTLNNVLCQTKLYNGSIYIPGSSIKGFIKSAIMYNLLKNDKFLKEKYWRLLNEKINEPRFNKNDINKIEKPLEEELLHRLSLKDEKDKNVGKGNAVCSVMRGIQCSDAYCDKNVTTAVLQKLDLTFNKYGKIEEKLLPLFKECIINDNVFICDLKIDNNITKIIRINTIDDLLKIMDEFFAELNNILFAAFGKDCPEHFSGVNSANLFLGSGTGFLTKTLLAFLAPDKKAAVGLIKVILDKQFRKHKHIELDKKISPRTLKITKYKGRKELMGLAKLEKL